jgi:hypothetical protein
MEAFLLLPGASVKSLVDPHCCFTSLAEFMSRGYCISLFHLPGMMYMWYSSSRRNDWNVNRLFSHAATKRCTKIAYQYHCVHWNYPSYRSVTIPVLINFSMHAYVLDVIATRKLKISIPCCRMKSRQHLSPDGCRSHSAPFSIHNTRPRWGLYCNADNGILSSRIMPSANRRLWPDERLRKWNGDLFRFVGLFRDNVM